MMNY